MTLGEACPPVEDPWADVEATPERAAALRLVALERRLRAVAGRLGAHGPGALAIAETIARIHRLYSRDAMAWRRTRAFAVAHGPLLVETIERLAETGAPDDVADRLMACGRLADAALQNAKEPREVALEVSLETLEALVAPISASDEPPPRKRNFFDRTIALFPGRISDRVPRAVRDVHKRVADEIEAAATQAQVLTERTAAELSNLAHDAWRQLANPVERNVGAALATAKETVISGSRMSMIAAVLFPPAAPFLIARDLLKLDERYAKAIDVRIARQDAEHAERLRLRRLSLEARIKQLKGLPRRLSFETDALSLSIDLDHMEVEGIILRGKHAGAALDRIDDLSLAKLAEKAPDPQTREILEIVAGMRNRPLV